MMRSVSQRRSGAWSTVLVFLWLALAVVTEAKGNTKRHLHLASNNIAGPRPAPISDQRPSLTTVAEWTNVVFDFEGNETREQEYRNSGRYEPANILPIDADIAGNKTFVTTPLFRTGTPATFSHVVNTSQTLNPPLRPYPRWEDHATSRDSLVNCSTQMVSVFRSTRVWSDNRYLYLVDCGVLAIASTFEKLCPPKIVTLDVDAGTIVNMTQIDKEDCNSLYIAIQVEEVSPGRRVAYTADVTGFYIAVTDMATGRTNRLISQYFYPTPRFGVTTIGGVRSFLMDGIFALGQVGGTLYSWAFASNTLNQVSTRVLREANDGQVLDLTVEVLAPGQRDGPAGAMAVDSTGRRMFFGLADREELYCWDTSRPYLQRSFRLLARDAESLQFMSGLKALRNDSTLLVVTDRYNKFIQGLLDNTTVNYRVMTANIQNLAC